MFGVNTAFESNYTREQSLHHNIGFNYYYLFDRAESTEHNIHFMLDLDKKMEFFSFSEMEKLGLNGDVNFYLNNDTINGSFNSGLTTIAPYYSLQFDQYLFRVGVNTAIQSDSGCRYMYIPNCGWRLRLWKII